MDTTEAKQIAQTIQRQLGLQYIPMIGAYNQLFHPEGALSFRFKAKASKINGKAPNYIKIALGPSDTYTVAFGRVRGLDYSICDIVEGVYCDQLRSLIEDCTGLRLSLGRMAA